MDLILGALFALVAGFGSAWWLCRWLLHRASRGWLLDHPNPRSSHTVPTPRGGGLGIALGFALASAGLWGAGLIAGRAWLAVLGGGVWVAGIGFLDDLGHVAICWRLLVHAGATVWGLSWMTTGHGPYLWFGGAGLALVWLVNLYNFMDGIDGLAGTQAVSVAASAALILWLGGQVGLALWLLSLAAAAGGFLVWNWPPAKIFMGDVGSGFVGFVFGMLALATSQTDAINLWSWAILQAVFITDASFTLLRRISSGQRFWEAHRTHAYQHLAQRFGHLPVTAAVGAINLVWLLPLAWTAARYPEAGVGLTGIAYAPLVWIALRARAGLA